MKKLRVLAVDFPWADELGSLLDRSLVEFEPLMEPAPDVRDAALAKADVLVSGRFSASMGRASHNLKLLVCPAAGTERIDRSALPKGVRLVNASGHEYPMAEYILGCLVALRQHVLESDASLRRGEWRYGFSGGMRMVDELYGTQLGLIGFGRIGQEVARRGAAFGMRCSAVTLHPKRHEQRAKLESLGRLDERADVDALVRNSDQIVVCCELSPLTEGLIDGRRLELMKRNAVLVNVARGAVVVEADLFAALQRKRIGGAAIDVWYQYPSAGTTTAKPSKLPFETLGNIIMTPHSSGWTEAAKQRRLSAMATDIHEFARRYSDEQKRNELAEQPTRS